MYTLVHIIKWEWLGYILSNNEDKILIYKKYSVYIFLTSSIWHRSRNIWHIIGVVSMRTIHWHNFQPKMWTLFSKVNFRTFWKKSKVKKNILKFSFMNQRWWLHFDKTPTTGNVVHMIYSLCTQEPNVAWSIRKSKSTL